MLIADVGMALLVILYSNFRLEDVDWNRWLKFTGDNIDNGWHLSSTAYAPGFEETTHFNNCFLKQAGQRPFAFREQ